MYVVNSNYSGQSANSVPGFGKGNTYQRRGEAFLVLRVYEVLQQVLSELLITALRARLHGVLEQPVPFRQLHALFFQEYQPLLTLP